jgi:uncharacterized protein (TIGR02145 family)
MKKIICLFAFVAALASCRKRDVEVSQPVNTTPSAQVSNGEVKFGFEIVNTNSAGANPRLEAADLKQIMVTIEDDKGVVVANKVTIDLILFNGSYISKPLVLGNGNYVLKEFLVLDAQSAVQYATPTAGSALAYLVQTALPQSFTVAKDKLTNMIPQVVNVANKKAGDFGYLSFNFTVVETLDFNIAVFAFNTATASFDLIASEVTVKNGTTQMFKGTVPATIDAISILDEKAGTYTLEVAQTGYKTYTNTYTYDALKAALKDPINIVLEEDATPVAATVTDIDGNVYPAVTIGTQVWMGENLRVEKYNDGTTIPLVTDKATWAANYTNKTKLPMMAWYDNDKATHTANKNGALYNWYAVDTKKLCPTGWHVPTDAEWKTLTDYLGGVTGAGLKLKSTSAWNSSGNGTNEVNFTALPGGYIYSNDGASRNLGDFGSWWSSSADDISFAWVRTMDSNSGNVNRYYFTNQESGLSVRCLRD